MPFWKTGSMNETALRWIPLAAWVVLIFAASSIPGLGSDVVDLPAGFDKIVHAIEYAVLALLLYRGLAFGDPRPRVSVALIVIALGIGVAALDELYQSSVPGRVSSAADLVADAVGVAGGTLAAVAHRLMRGRKADRE